MTYERLELVRGPLVIIYAYCSTCQLRKDVPYQGSFCTSEHIHPFIPKTEDGTFIGTCLKTPSWCPYLSKAIEDLKEKK